MTTTARLSFKAFKTYPRLSEETLAFTATVLLDGKAIGEARNDGHGGPNVFVPKDGEALKAFHALVKAMPPTVYSWGEVPACYDTVLGDLVSKAEAAKERAALERKAKKLPAGTSLVVALYPTARVELRLATTLLTKHGIDAVLAKTRAQHGHEQDVLTFSA